MGKLQTLKCKQCDGEMIKKTMAKHSQGAALFLILLGIIFCILPGLFIIGIPLLIVGLIMGSVVKKVWLCKSCGTYFERK
jgi:uncharacterized membrane protein SpoIIM required for sporulation